MQKSWKFNATAQGLALAVVALLTGCSGFYFAGKHCYPTPPLADGHCPTGKNMLYAKGFSTGISDAALGLKSARAQARASLMDMIATQVQDYYSQHIRNAGSGVATGPAKDKTAQITRDVTRTLAQGLVGNSCIDQVWTSKDGTVTIAEASMPWGEQQRQMLKSFSNNTDAHFSDFMKKSSDAVFNSIHQVASYDRNTPPAQSSGTTNN